MSNKYIKNLRKTIVRKESENRAMNAGVLGAVRKACAEAVRRYPALVRISLAGSIVGRGFSKDSDVDIVIAGLAKCDYFCLVSFLEERIGRRIDLIMEEDLSEKDRGHIFKNVEVIYDSKEG